MFCIFFIFNNLSGQNDVTQNENEPIFLSADSLAIDSASTIIDSLLRESDTFFILTDSLKSDTLTLTTDSLPQKKRLSPNAIESSIKYISQDSIILNLVNKKIFLFEDAKTYYDDIELTAAYMEFGFVNSELYASGVADSCGHIHGPPVFKQGSSEFCSQEIRYNFNTKKGKVTKVITSEGEGFIHGYYVKHVDDRTSYIKDGQYTTCNLPHPHFQIRFNKAKVIQDEKIITGPAYLSFGNVPTPLVIPFGYFPLQKERASGIVIGQFGEGAIRGFYFENFGYYFGINDNFDLLLSGDITTRGNWAAKAKGNYVFRYKFNGVVDLLFAQNFSGERGTPSREHTNDFRVYWKHNQDPKFHPTTRFNAHVNVISQSYTRNNPSSTADYLSNQFTSSLNFSTSTNGFFFFDAALYYNQSTLNKTIGISLPDLNMSIRQLYPFRKKHKSGKLKWYDNISLKWTSQMANRINTVDSLFFKPQTWQEIQSGIQHNIPLNIPIKVGKAFNWNTNFTLNEKWYLQRNERTFATDTVGDRVYPLTNDVFQRGFYALHDVSLSTSLTTRVFFLYSFKKGGLKAVRHVMSPVLDFTFRPNLSGNTYGTYFNTITGEEVQYSYFSGAIYGSVANRTQAITRLTINNNLEIKVRSRKDTITGTRKITLFDNVSVSTGYDFAADSLNWQPFSITGRTSLFSFLDITFGLRFDPYIIGKNGQRVNQTELKVNNRALRFSESNLNIGVNWRLNQDFFKGKKKKEEPISEPAITPPDNLLGMPNRRPDFTNPWNVTINYTFAYLTFDNRLYYQHLTGKKYDSNIIQTINLSADVSITRKWKVKIDTGYDIQQKDFSFTRFEVYRDLHCWEMSFHWIPFGHRKEWGFKINVKASVLQDLKYDMRRDFRDNIY
jgi:hypothetical protein